jgi:hypothetical protein
VIDILTRLTRPTIKKLMKLYMSEDCKTNKSFVKKAMETATISAEESHLIWLVFDVSYDYWFRRVQE